MDIRSFVSSFDFTDAVATLVAGEEVVLTNTKTPADSVSSIVAKDIGNVFLVDYSVARYDPITYSRDIITVVFPNGQKWEKDGGMVETEYLPSIGDTVIVKEMKYIGGGYDKSYCGKVFKVDQISNGMIFATVIASNSTFCPQGTDIIFDGHIASFKFEKVGIDTIRKLSKNKFVIGQSVTWLDERAKILAGPFNDNGQKVYAITLEKTMHVIGIPRIHVIGRACVNEDMLNEV